MKAKSLKLNMALNAVKSLMGIVFPLISFPYVAKTLSVTDLGQYNFASSVIGYFALFAQLGISSYAVREGAGIRDDQEKLKKFCGEILSINMLATVIVYIVFFMCLLTVPKFHGYTVLLLTFSVQIIFTTIGTEWIFGIYSTKSITYHAWYFGIFVYAWCDAYIHCFHGVTGIPRRQRYDC